MNDLISRQEALAAIEQAAKDNLADVNCHYLMGFQDAAEVIREMPETYKWIPVSERLPEGGVMVLVTARPKKGEANVNRAYYMSGSWHGSGSMAGVVAWMPLPEPFTEEDEDEGST